MKYFILTISFFFTFSSTSQTKILDSTYKVIENYKTYDTTYVNLRNEYATAKLIVSPKDSTLLDFSLKTLKVSKELNYLRGELVAYEKIAIVYQWVFSNPNKALDYCHKVIEIATYSEKFKDKAISMNINIGAIYGGLEEYKKALIYYKKALPNKPKNIALLNNIASAYGGLLKLDSSIVYYKKAIKVGRASNSKLYLANILSNLSLVLDKANRTDEAIGYVEESIDLVNKHNLQILRAHAYKSGATIYLKKLNYNKAEKYALEALKSTKSINYSYIKRSVWEMLFNLYETKGDYKNAFKFYKSYTVLNDSLNSNNTKLEIERKQIQFEADREKLIAKNEVKQQKAITNISIFTGSILLLLAIVGFALYKRKQKAEFNVKVANTELKALRAQMNPHFIFNSLNSIGDYILNNNIKSAHSYLTQFAKLMRQILENSEENLIPLTEDLETLKNYIDIEKKRLNNSFDYKIIVDNTIDTEAILVPPLILQPFVENSIWHGVSKQKELGKIIIEIKNEGNMLLCSVEDNGVGRGFDPKNESNNDLSLGIKITKNRLDIINHKKTTKANLTIIDKETGTRVEIKLPIELAF